MPTCKILRSGRTVDLEAIKSLLYSTIDVVLYFDQRRLKEVYFDPIYVQEMFG
ncbi:CpaF/VirB11 family protein [Moraxella caprae]|uniref:CpaF/VirB11 family protein n=1 Tax=Moraxella caprae TaxID=90240 RepID=UPI001E457F24|nr:CpaF/VirB11 family protein [Moraxella caprae]